MIRLQEYTRIELGFARAMWEAWNRRAPDLDRKLVNLIRNKEYDQAINLLQRIDVKLIAHDIESTIRRTVFTGLTFGAMLATGSDRVKYQREPIPPVMTAVVAFIENSLDRIRLRLVDTVQSLILDREVKTKAEDDCACHPVIDVLKSGSLTLAEKLNAVVMGQARTLIDVAANATTTRLVGLGFLDQARSSGIETYQITSELDGRVCPVCRTLHGKTFSVAPAYDRLLGILMQSDPEVIKQMAPWPSQSKSNVEFLRSQTSDQLAGSGLDTPPFHGGCRCRQVLVGTVPPDEIMAVVGAGAIQPQNLNPAELTLAVVAKLGKTWEEDGKVVAANPMKRVPLSTVDKIDKARAKVLNEFGLLMQYRTSVPDFDPAKLSSYQETVQPAIIAQYMANPVDDPLTVYKLKNRYMIGDGHHRALAAMLMGKTFKAVIEDLDAALKAIPKKAK